MPAQVILATAGYDHSIRFWEAPIESCYRTVQYADSQVNALQITPDKQFIAAAGHSHVRLFDVNSNNPQPVTSYDGHSSNVTAVGFHKDGRWMYTGSEDGTMKIWDLRATGCQRNYDCCTAGVNTVALHPNQGELISGDQLGTLKVWDLGANRCLYETVPEEDAVALRSVSIASDASCVVGANNNGNVFVWDPSNAKNYVLKKRFQAHNSYILKCHLSPDVQYLATASNDRTVKLWHVAGPPAEAAAEAGQEEQQPMEPAEPPAPPQQQQQQPMFASAEEEESRGGGFTYARTLAGHQRWVWDCVFSADSDFLVTGSSDHTAKLWDVHRGQIIRNYKGHHKAVTCVALNDSSLGEVPESSNNSNSGGVPGSQEDD